MGVRNPYRAWKFVKDTCTKPGVRPGVKPAFNPPQEELLGSSPARRPVSSHGPTSQIHRGQMSWDSRLRRMVKKLQLRLLP